MFLHQQQQQQPSESPQRQVPPSPLRRPCNIQRKNAKKGDAIHFQDVEPNFVNPLLLTVSQQQHHHNRRDSDASTSSTSTSTSQSMQSDIPPIQIPKWMTEITVRR
jgi:hypothetical protein